MAKKKGLYANIHAKRKRIKAGSGEKMRKPGSKGAPTAANFKRAAKTAKKRKKTWNFLLISNIINYYISPTWTTN